MKRFLKIVGILTVFAAIFGYFVFRVMFFDPFEGEFDGTENLVPRDVHVMVRRAELSEDFESFPNPTFFEALRVHPKWRDFSKTETYRDYEESWGLAEKVADLESQLAELEGVFDIMDDMLGREAMVVGRYREGGELGTALLFRGSFRTKLYAEAVRYGFVRDQIGEEVESYREEGQVAVLELNDGSEIGILRRLDLIVVGDDVSLVTDIADMADGKGFSLSDSPYYVKALEEESDAGRPVDFAVDLGAMARESDFATLDFGEDSPVHLEWLSRSLIPGDFGIVAGRLFLGNEIDLAIRGSGDMANIKANGGGLYDGAATKTEDLYRFCGSIFPQKTFACGYLKIDIRDFLLRLIACLDRDTTDNMNAFVQQLRRHREGRHLSTIGTVVDLVEHAHHFFGDEVIFGFEPQDTYQQPAKPGEEPRTIVPHKSWGPRVALCVPVVDKGAAEQLVKVILESSQDGATIYTWSYRAWNYEFKELEFGGFEEPSICAGFVEFEPEGFDKREFLVITTTGQFLDEIVRVRHGEFGHPPLIDASEDYSNAPVDLQPFSQGFVYLSSKGLMRAVRDLSEWWAEIDSEPDYRTLRQEATVRLRDQKYPHERGRPVKPEQHREFEYQVDQEMEDIQFRWRNDELPKAVEDTVRELAHIELFNWAILTFRASDRDVAFRLRARTVASFPD